MALDVGVLGYRFMGKAHSNAMARLPMFFPDAPEINRAVLIGRDKEALSDAAARFGFSWTTTDPSEAIADIDVFYNLGPNFIHPEYSIEALEADVPVFCEKPLAPTLEEAEEMTEAYRGANVPAGCAFNYRFVPAIRYAKNLIESGELGDIYHIRGHYLQDWLADPEAPWSWRLDKELAGSGALGDLGAHTIDLARFLVGNVAGEITDVTGHLQTFVDERPGEDGKVHNVTVDDAYFATAEFESGTVGSFEATRNANGHKNDLTIKIEGSTGSLKFSLKHLNELEYKREGSRGFETILVTDAEDPYIDHWWPPGHVIGWEHTFVHENYEFLSAVAEDDEFEPSFNDGLATQQILAAIQESDAIGQRVSIT